MKVEGFYCLEMCKVSVSGPKVKLYLKSHPVLCIEQDLEYGPVIIHALIWKLWKRIK